MMLTAKLYQEIISSLRTDPRPISDRRRYPRVGLRAKVNITPLDENRRPIGTLSVGVRDFSAGGFGLIVPPDQLKAGQLFIIRMERPLAEPMPILCEVVQRHSTDRIGARILHSLEPAPKKTILSEGEVVEV